MFTHVVDDAINRFEYKGMEIAVTYDEHAENPLDIMEIKGFAIRSHERDTIDYDPDRTLRDYQGLLEDKDNAIGDIEVTFVLLRERYGKTWWEWVDENTTHYAGWAQDVIDDIEAIDDYNDQLESYEVYEFVAVDEYGHPRYTVVVDVPLFKRSWGPSCSEYKDIAMSLAKDYAAWVNGSVYVIGVERGEDEEDSLVGGVIGIDPYDEKALIEFVENNFVC
ncbi:hypothetical protein [Corynebacterium guaraldiae]|uniref:hypothetical protein n=1 Tax=Corynebacterium guaraldiae TaxID=3051103 RepID=UPI0011784F58|nr:hypothetical protein [Corynebacterium guaraldiae]TRX43735.1 hypothetical protein FNY89_01120 [Corynebacterium guaraldiae]